MRNLEIVLVIAGILTFLYAFIVMRRISTLLTQSANVPASMISACRALGALVLLFSCGYCLFCYFLITDQELLVDIRLVVSVIFFWGSIFVILSFLLFHSVLLHRIAIEDTLRDTTSQLVQSRKSEALGCLAGGVAHDFNNVLMIISNYADISMHYAEGHPELTEALRNLVAGAEQGRGLTQQLLAFCRKRPVEHQLISLADVVNGSRSMLSELTPANITLAVTCRVPGWVAGAEDQIQLALINLVLNARDAMADGGQITITLSYTCSESVGNTTNYRKVLLEVADTGHGMDADTMARVFDPYFTTKKGGNGLGLSMVASTVEQHGGQLRVVSDVGKGTRFQILLDEKEQLQDT